MTNESSKAILAENPIMKADREHAKIVALEQKQEDADEMHLNIIMTHFFKNHANRHKALYRNVLKTSMDKLKTEIVQSYKELKTCIAGSIVHKDLLEHIETLEYQYELLGMKSNYNNNSLN